MIKVISGKYKGKRLKRVPSEKVRPMPNKLKETLISIIQSLLPHSIFLDGFSGTGSVGIEALSRGAENVVFVDEYFPSVKIIKENLGKCGEKNNFLVIQKEFNRAVIQLAKDNRKFDLIFLDPPYRLLDERNPLKIIKKRNILKTGGLIILRHHFKTKVDEKFYKSHRRVRIGDDVLSFFVERENISDKVLK